MRNSLFLSFSLLFLANFVVAQMPVTLQSPDDFLGYTLGEQFTPHNRIVDYFRYVAATRPDVVKVTDYGKTWEGRPLIAAVVTSADNMRNLNTIQDNHLRKTGLKKGEIDTKISPKAIVWLSFSVHGNEPSGTESSMITLFKLANALPNSEIANELKNAVVILDPSLNPDGYSRYVHWYNSVADRLPNPSPEAREHLEPYPQGRTNHYNFDLNRDWAWATQIETQQRLLLYRQWLPHVHADLHEMGYEEPYYFAPAATPVHPYVTPFQMEFQTKIGDNHAKLFDQNGWLYFTKEVFDLFYPSYGDTYPTFSGSVGMTYEQGGIGAGREINLENGQKLTLKDRIWHHHTTAMSTVEVSAKNVQQLDDNFLKYFQEAQNQPKGEYKTFVIKIKNENRAKIRHFCTLLDRHNIRYGRMAGDGVARGLSYATGKETNFNIGKEDLVISAAQPMGVLTQVLFDPESTLQDSLTYDATAWALPHAFGLDAYAVKMLLPVTENFEWDKSVLYPKPTTLPYAYLAEWSGVNNARFLATIQQKNVKVRSLKEEITVKGKKWQRGTLLITKADNSDLVEQLDRIIASAALQTEQQIELMASGITDNGVNLGSSKADLLTRPKVALLYDDDSDVTSNGQVWQFFDVDLGMSLSTVKTQDFFQKGRLNRYNTLILTDGKYSNLDSIRLARLNRWVLEGGKIILIGDAVGHILENKTFDLSRYATKKDAEGAEEKEEKELIMNRLVESGNAERYALSDNTSGAVVRFNLDNTNPLGYGMPNYYYSLKTSSIALPLQKSVRNIGFLPEKFMSYGFIGYRLREKLDNSLNIGVQSQGRGTVVYLVDNPLHRSCWIQGKLLMANALFLKQ